MRTCEHDKQTVTLCQVNNNAVKILPMVLRPPPPPIMRKILILKDVLVKIFRNKDLSSIFGLNSHFWGGLGADSRFCTLGSLSPAEHLGLSKSTGCPGLAGQSHCHIGRVGSL
jgi:hypothetical protein